jgi:hypothetical protein
MTAEDRLQIGVCRLLDALKLDWWHTPNEAKRSPALGAHLKKKGLKAGIPDILIVNTTKQGDVGLAIELKIYPNKTTSKQEEWRAKLVRHGWAYAVAYDIDTVIQLVSKHYGR